MLDSADGVALARCVDVGVDSLRCYRGAVRDLAVTLAFVLIACGGKGDATPGAGPSPGPPATTGPGLAGIKACQSMIRGLDALMTCAPAAERNMMARLQEPQRKIYGDTTAISAEQVQLYARSCILQLGEMAESMRPYGCKFELTGEEQAWFDGEHRRRTQATGVTHAASRESLAQVIGFRDRMCACKDAACTEIVATALDASLEAGAGKLSHEDDVARDAASRVIDELTHCQGWIERRARRSVPEAP